MQITNYSYTFTAALSLFGDCRAPLASFATLDLQLIFINFSH